MSDLNDENKKDFLTINTEDEDYPELLREIPDLPEKLHIKGSCDAWRQPCVAVVGTRKATSYGLKAARELSRDLASLGITIVSGLALGIDTEAHKGALEANGATVAVLGSGINQIYPATNRSIAQKIIDSGGAVVSELPPDKSAEKWTFPQRNRIVAGMSRLTLVIEAPERSGALITAYLALDYNREVGAVPGEITSINSRGTNDLIRRGASLIRSADDVLEILGMQKNDEAAAALDNLDEMEKLILQSLSSPQNADELTRTLAIPIGTLNQKLSMLELKGVIKNMGGMWHKN